MLPTAWRAATPPPPPAMPFQTPNLRLWRAADSRAETSRLVGCFGRCIDVSARVSWVFSVLMSGQQFFSPPLMCSRDAPSLIGSSNMPNNNTNTTISNKTGIPPPPTGVEVQNYTNARWPTSLLWNNFAPSESHCRRSSGRSRWFTGAVHSARPCGVLVQGCRSFALSVLRPVHPHDHRGQRAHRKRDRPSVRPHGGARGPCDHGRCAALCHRQSSTALSSRRGGAVRCGARTLSSPVTSSQAPRLPPHHCPGAKFRKMAAEDPKALARLLPDLKVLARSSPSDKLLLVATLLEQGEVVAVTGTARVGPSYRCPQPPHPPVYSLLCPQTHPKPPATGPSSAHFVGALGGSGGPFPRDQCTTCQCLNGP